MENVERLGRLILDPQRGARSRPAEAFIGWALDTLARELPFDSALWGAGHATPEGPHAHTLTLHRQPPQMMADYARIQRHDAVFARSAQQLGRTVAARTRDWVPAELTPYLERYGIEQALSTIDVDPVTSLLDCIALWRRDRSRPFTEDERRFMQAVFPHLTAACTHNRLAHLLRSGVPPRAGPWRAAAADRTGLLHHADADFAPLLRLEWPGWTGPQLPAPLAQALGASAPRRLALPAVVIEVQPLAELSLVRAREGLDIDRLTPRERDVALRAAQGFSHKQIARLLELSPATVRNHLAAAYRRLGIGSQAQLAARVRAAE